MIWSPKLHLQKDGLPHEDKVGGDTSHLLHNPGIPILENHTVMISKEKNKFNFTVLTHGTQGHMIPKVHSS
jgi:hypothetical protein